ncbi:MAG: DNA polymerase III subunit gamma/tau [Candidatus Nomurabacteria bacterium]|jgi:DNA polymerase-3 subunit gamma/tau|nr:DNA polymerase III subunit gamma/tau [Candidatus Nomurabacteria bacterium]
MGKALYRKYRSKSLNEVIGQKHVTDILAAALKQGRVSHAYLFTGPRGVGKTSVARILAHEINGLPYTEEDSYLDIIEIDAASNNGVDDIRNLREKVMIAPTSSKKKVYIIDEVHMLSKPAFNALLKTLEEPPEHVVFIMATTDVHKVPVTIISRSQQFAFKFIQPEDAVKHLRNIANKESIKIADEALGLIAKKGGGSFRDSISLLDQLSSVLDDREISRADAEQALGLASEELLQSLLDSHAAGDTDSTVKYLNQALETGSKPETITEQLMKYIIYDIKGNLNFLELLDKLPEVAKSSYPEVKLLTVLVGTFANMSNPSPDRPKQPPVTAPLPTTPTPPSETPGCAPVVTGHSPRLTPSVVTDWRRSSGGVELANKGASSVDAQAQQVNSKKLGEENAPDNVQTKESDLDKQSDKRIIKSAQDFSWDALLEDIKENRPTLYIILAKCGHTVEDSELKVYAKNKLWKNKLDTAAFRKRVAEHGGENLEVTVLAKAAPTGNGTVDAIADIMGGGEEVEVDAE